jgi:hypothetical protein
MVFGVKISPLIAFVDTPTVGKLSIGVGKGVVVRVGVNNSAPINVTVGVNVRGVLVDVAKRFCVGLAVWLGAGVGLWTGGGGVADALNAGTLMLGRAEQPARKTPSTKI